MPHSVFAPTWPVVFWDLAQRTPSQLLAADGRLDWDAPAGSWTILRIGYTLTVYVSNDATKFSLEEVAIDGLPPIKIREGARYNSAEEAFTAGHERARETISH